MTREDADYNLGYFKEFPAPMFEGMCRLNPSDSINGTCPHYGVLLYAVAKIIGAHNSLEIGTAEGWCSGFMAHAIAENNSRFKMNGRHYSLDIIDRSNIQDNFDAAKLPATFIQCKDGSVKWLEKQTIFTPESLSLVFVDSYHNNAYLEREVELLYPLLKGNGDGYLALHDTGSFVQLADREILKNPDYKWERVRFLNNYGLSLYRKMDGWDEEKILWPEGDQHHLPEFAV